MGYKRCSSTNIEKEITQSYIQLSYINKSGEQIDALFLNTYGKKFSTTLAEKINSKLGKNAPEEKLQYEI
ncbi:hypothetical protein YDYSY3_60520 [Paenibacillus chitinolyticus]|nr:hypothetical protein YDYSY3_60520 [Paenibacillus chitinolyticus]